MSLPEGYDIVLIDDGEFEGYQLVNPEGEVFLDYRVLNEMSPGRIALLQEAEERILKGDYQRAILANEADAFYTRARGRV